ncbi:MAG: thioredoxin-dependent thiol peroxidase [Acidobacteriota bacterium]
MAELRVGQKAPSFTLEGSDGRKHTLKEFLGKKVVLYFYPKDNTSGCTKEACSFRDNLGAIEEKGAVVVGMSPDSAASHRKFIEKQGLNFLLLSDEDKAALEPYGVWKQKSLYGRTYMGVERTTVVIDEKGVITHIFPKVKVDGHTEEVLNALS